MSGPKLIELRRMRAALERQRNHDRCAAFGSEYARLLQEFHHGEQRLARLAVPAEDRVRPLESIRAEIDHLLRQEAHHEAARIFGEEVSRLRAVLEKQRERFEERWVTLQNRHRQLVRDQQLISAQRSRSREHLNAAIPTSWKAEERKRVQNLIEQALEKVIQPETGGFPEDLGAIEQFEKAESVAGTSLTALREAQRQVETELNATHARLLGGSPPGSAPVSPLVQLLQGLAPSAAPNPFEDKSSVEIDKLLAQLAAVPDSFLQTARNKAEEIPAENDPVRRRVLAEALMIECSARLKQLREAARRREQAQRLIDSAAHLNDPAVNAVVDELRRMFAADPVTDLEPVRLRLQTAIQAAEALREREYKRRALIDSLKELGYETNEVLQTAFVKEGRLVLRRADEDEYAVQMVANPDLNQLQTALVRYADNSEMTEQQKRRDREREETWCADHARLCEMMAGRGLETQFKMQIKPGEHPVKVVLNQARAALPRRQPVEKDLLRKRNP